MCWTTKTAGNEESMQETRDFLKPKNIFDISVRGNIINQCCLFKIFQFIEQYCLLNVNMINFIINFLVTSFNPLFSTPLLLFFIVNFALLINLIKVWQPFKSHYLLNYYAQEIYFQQFPHCSWADCAAAEVWTPVIA